MLSAIAVCPRKIQNISRVCCLPLCVIAVVLCQLYILELRHCLRLFVSMGSFPICDQFRAFRKGFYTPHENRSAHSSASEQKLILSPASGVDADSGRSAHSLGFADHVFALSHEAAIPGSARWERVRNPLGETVILAPAKQSRPAWMRSSFLLTRWWCFIPSVRRNHLFSPARERIRA